MEKIGKMVRKIILLYFILFTNYLSSQVDIFEKLNILIINNWKTDEKINLDTIISVTGNIHVDTFKISKILPNPTEVLNLINQINSCEVEKIKYTYNLYLDLYLSEFSHYKYFNMKIVKYQSIIIEFEKLIFNCSFIKPNLLNDSLFSKFYISYILTSNCWWNKDLSVEELNNKIDSIHTILGFNKKFIKLLINQTGFRRLFGDIVKENIVTFNPYLVSSMENFKSVVNFKNDNNEYNEIPQYLEAEYFEYYKDYTSQEFQIYLANNLDKILKRKYVYMWQVIGNTDFLSADSLFNVYFLGENISSKIQVEFESYIYSNTGKERAARLIINALNKCKCQDNKLNYFLALTKTKNARIYFKNKFEGANKSAKKRIYQKYLDIIEVH